MPNWTNELRRSIRSCGDERRVDRRSLSKIEFPQFDRFFYDKLGPILSPDARLDGNALSFLNLSGKNVWGKKFSRLGVRSRKSRKFLPCKNFPLYGIYDNDWSQPHLRGLPTSLTNRCIVFIVRWGLCTICSYAWCNLIRRRVWQDMCTIRGKASCTLT